MARVAELMGEWAVRLELSASEQTRWRAAAWLHDSLRDADPETLRDGLESPFRDMPGYYLHGPAAATRLETAGVTDAELLDAVRYHTLGKAGLGRLGRALIAADWLDPGRPQLPLRRAVLRARMPDALDDVVAAIVDLKVRASLERGKPLRVELAEMWSSLVAGDGRAR